MSSGSGSFNLKEKKRPVFGLTEEQMDDPDLTIVVDPEEFVKGLKTIDHFDPLPWQVM